MPPQLSYGQNAIIAQPGMAFDGDVFTQDRVSRIASAVCPFGALCEMDANGNAQPMQTATTLAGTVTVTNGSATATFTTAQTLAAGQALIFSDQPTVTYYVALAVAASTTATLTALYSGTGGATKLASTGFNPNNLGVCIYDPFGEEESYQSWSVPVTLAGTVTVTNGSAALTFTTAQTLVAGTVLNFSDQPGTPYTVLTTTSASTSATLTQTYTGTGGAGKTATSSQGGSTCPGYKIGRSIPLMRRGRIWALGDATGTVQLYGAINVNHSSTGAFAQGVFTFSAVSLTVGHEIDIAPGITLYQPGGMGFSGNTAPTNVVDPFGNTFSIYPVEVRL